MRNSFWYFTILYLLRCVSRRNPKKILIMKVQSVLKTKKSKKRKRPGSTEEPEWIRSLIECPVCQELPRLNQQIFGCRNGHSLCQRCRGKVNKCPVCRELDLNCRSLVTEKILQNYLKTCKNEGCGETRTNLEALSFHEKFCQYQRVTCPWVNYRTCTWTGPKINLQIHVQMCNLHQAFGFKEWPRIEKFKKD